jgi:hypothetical protein
MLNDENKKNQLKKTLWLRSLIPNQSNFKRWS